MSKYLTADGGPGEQVASNSGWGDFVRWASTLPLPSFINVVQLAEYGEAADPGAVASEIVLSRAAYHPPTVEGLGTTLDNLVRVLNGFRGEDAVFVTDGF